MKNLISLLLLTISPYWLIAQYQPTTNGELIKHDYYSLSYNEDHEQAEWVYYKITKGNAGRTDDFRIDAKVSTGSATLADYKGSGYDRGHLCPAAAMKVNHEAMSQTFYMSNMSPQKPYFNRGIWKNLEALVRNWGYSIETHVVTGPIFRDNKGVIGSNQVTVPGYYYKVVYQPDKKRMIGFILANQKTSIKTFDSFIFPVDSIETLTGIDFFHQLEDKLENKLERTSADISSWPSSSSGSVKSSYKPQSSLSSQCLGTAKSTGQRCKNKTTNANGYCHVHQSQSPDYKAPPKQNYSGRCCATTKAGTRCKRNASTGSRYCWQHQ